ncbi:MAG: hypothetical protein BWX99_02372 [Deltaproteobacteria bacterium ADurb.Bin151]|nr:MAG: hypothetical protein BWX99_02372 [Deltaproteobacteria bacterium ADurb.Bin151]
MKCHAGHYAEGHVEEQSPFDVDDHGKVGHGPHGETKYINDIHAQLKGLFDGPQFGHERQGYSQRRNQEDDDRGGVIGMHHCSCSHGYPDDGDSHKQGAAQRKEIFSFQHPAVAVDVLRLQTRCICPRMAVSFFEGREKQKKEALGDSDTKDNVDERDYRVVGVEDDESRSVHIQSGLDGGEVRRASRVEPDGHTCQLPCIRTSPLDDKKPGQSDDDDGHCGQEEREDRPAGQPRPLPYVH